MYKKETFQQARTVGTIKLRDIGQTEFENLLNEIAQVRCLSFDADYKTTETRTTDYQDPGAYSDLKGEGWEKVYRYG